MMDLIALAFIRIEFGGAGNDAMYGLMLSIWFVCLFWHSMVCMNVAHVVCCGVMASWFYGQETEGVTAGAFKRAITTSFGSICLGSLLTAIMRALKVLADAAKDNAKDGNNGAAAVVFACIACLLECLGDILEYFNTYVYVQVAIFGKSYWQSAKDTLQLFKATGAQAIVNDDLTHIPVLIGFALSIPIILVAVVCAQAALNVKAPSSVFMGLWMGIMIYYCLVSVISSYVKTLFVCWIQDPAQLSLDRPVVFNKMMQAAKNRGYDTGFAHVNPV